MNSLTLAAALASAGARLATGRWIAAVVFLGLLAALGWGLWRARKQALCDEADAALEADFRRLESEVRR